MRVHRFTRQQTLPISLETAWDFFSDPENLAEITPPWLGFRLLEPAEKPAYAGQILRYTLSPLPGYRTRWVTELTHVRAPDFFVDEQRQGPYSLWHHQHRFTPVDQGVLMEDMVHYALPFSPFSDWLILPMIRQRINTIFDYRYKRLDQLFGPERSA